MVVYKKTVATEILISILAVSVFVLINSSYFGTVQAATEVTGIIATDTMWTKTNSPYNLTGNVLISNGATLTIESGATINLNGYYILVNGTLSSRGTSANPININGGDYIAFTPFSSNWAEQTTTGSIIENSFLNATRLFIYASPKINNNIFQNIDFQYVPIAISNVWEPSSMVYVPSTNSSPVISNNIISGGISIQNMWGHGGSPDTACPQISNNTITSSSNNVGNGIYTFYSTGLISNNTISGFQQGLYLHSDYGTLIEGNLILGNSKGVVTNVHQDPTTPIIANNTVTYNGDGFSLIRSFSAATNPVIVNNNIYGNINYNINLGIPDTINATYNWWGTTDTQAINQSIYDFKNDFNLGMVEFVPFLTAPNPAAPIIPTFNIVASAEAGGSISPSGTVSVDYGDSQTFTITADTGYHIVDVTVNGSSVGAVDSYTFTNVQADYTISATFALTSTPTSSPVIPEFPSFTILPCLIGVTLIVALVFKKKWLNKPL